MTSAGFASFARNLTNAFLPRPKKSARKAAGKKHHSTETQITQSLDFVLRRLKEDGHGRVLVIGNQPFLSDIKRDAPHLQLTWASCNIADVFDGALNPDDLSFLSFDAVICGGPDVVAGYRLALARMAEADTSRPVHWVAENWEFCGGTFPVPADIDDVEALLFNHFQHYFGIKDSLAFRIEVYCGSEIRRFYKILRANESTVLRLSDFYPQRRETAAFAVFVTHPALTRGRHYRLRVCADVFWRQSLTTLHGLHEFNRAPSHKFEFRLSAPDVQGGDVILTIPNYTRDATDNRLITAVDGQHNERPRDNTKLVEEERLSAEAINGKRYIGWKYAGYGGSNWYALSPENGPGGAGTIAGNHHASVSIAPLEDMAMAANERDELVRLQTAGYFLEPYALPVTRADQDLRFGFNCDSANPSYSDFIVHMFDAAGNRIGQDTFRKPAGGPVFTDALPSVADNDAVAMVMLTPDFERIRIRRKGFKTQFEQVVRHRRTGDWDVTEGQTCWRNVGLFVPSAAHFAGPTGSVVGRTNLTARARAGKGIRTALLATHASGRLDYKAQANLTLTVLDLKGNRRDTEIVIPSFTSRCIWLDDVWSDLADFLGPTGIGPMLTTSMNADVNCQIVTVTSAGAVSLQHMWGY